MKEKLGQLENLLIEIEKTIEKEAYNQKLIQEITIEDWEKSIEDLELPDYTDDKRKIIRDNFLKMKSDKSFEEVEIPRLKSILENAQMRLINFIHESDENNDRIIIRKFIEHKIITTDTQISFGNKKEGNVVGYLTTLGDFKVNLNGEFKSFSSFNDAAHAVNERARDGWSDWVANDKSGQRQNLGYFKKELSKIMAMRGDLYE